MARRVFYSFYFAEDAARAAQVRNMGLVEGNLPAHDNDWEQVKRGGDPAIKKWIADQLNGKSCCVVLIGSHTASRKWITYEISEAWNAGKGVLGVHVHNLQPLNQSRTTKGSNPLSTVTFSGTARTLASVAKAYDPPFADSKEVYAHIKRNLAAWIDEAVAIRTAS